MTEVTNEMLRKAFNVNIQDGDFKAVDKNGKVFMLTDLRKKFKIEFKAPSSTAKKVANQLKPVVTPAVVIANVMPLFNDIRTHFKSDNRADVSLVNGSVNVDYSSLGAHYRYDFGPIENSHTLTISLDEGNVNDLHNLFWRNGGKKHKGTVVINNCSIQDTFQYIHKLINVLELTC